ncbi:hypothetical protein C6P45_000315 [Maudiozyma exigua]|uniref:Uncharacterized protein n=1 Tax=Maudiozyma exigua TaxID=34358 RepID=A0A9P6W8M6_MAUEX|nr:hypothetical protein C6P45_000315 [Kazachstania exigua]
MSNSNNPDVFKRLQISPSKKNSISKPALRLSPVRKAHPSRDSQYTPSKYGTHLTSDRVTQSLDRTSVKFIPHFDSPSRSAIKTTPNGLSSSIVKAVSVSDTPKFRGSNLLNRLREEDSQSSIARQLMRENELRYKNRSDNKKVKFYLPSEENLQDEIKDMKSMFQQIIKRQDKLESSLEEIKLLLKIQNEDVSISKEHYKNEKLPKA